MMKVTFFLNQFPVVSETFVINQIIGLIKQGVDVNIIATSKGDVSNNHQAVNDYNLLKLTTYLTDESVYDSTLKKRLKRIYSVVKPKNIIKKVSAFNVNRFGIHSKSLLLPSIVSNVDKPIEADIFIAHFGTAGVVAHKMRELGLLQGKLVTVFHGSDISVKSILTVFKKDYQALFLAGELMLPISDLWKNKLIEYGCDLNKIQLNRMGINTEQFGCRAYNFPLSTPLKIITVARFTEKKGINDALSAMRILKEQGVEFYYNIVGDGELRPQLEKQITDSKLNQHVSLLGFQPQEKITQLLNGADVFLLPSVTASNGDMEGIPVALMEAMAMGLITVSTYHSGIPELITHNESGLLAPEHSPQEIAREITRLVNGEINTAQMRAMAKLKIEQSFEQLKLYKELVGILAKLDEF